jgi:hypothetical protein
LIRQLAKQSLAERVDLALETGRANAFKRSSIQVGAGTQFSGWENVCVVAAPKMSIGWPTNIPSSVPTDGWPQAAPHPFRLSSVSLRQAVAKAAEGTPYRVRVLEPAASKTALTVRSIRATPAELISALAIVARYSLDRNGSDCVLQPLRGNVSPMTRLREQIRNQAHYFALRQTTEFLRTLPPSLAVQFQEGKAIRASDLPPASYQLIYSAFQQKISAEAIADSTIGREETLGQGAIDLPGQANQAPLLHVQGTTVSLNELQEHMALVKAAKSEVSSP